MQQLAPSPDQETQIKSYRTLFHCRERGRDGDIPAGFEDGGALGGVDLRLERAVEFGHVAPALERPHVLLEGLPLGAHSYRRRGGGA